MCVCVCVCVPLSVCARACVHFSCFTYAHTWYEYMCVQPKSSSHLPPFTHPHTFPPTHSPSHLQLVFVSTGSKQFVSPANHTESLARKRLLDRAGAELQRMEHLRRLYEVEGVCVCVCVCVRACMHVYIRMRVSTMQCAPPPPVVGCIQCTVTNTHMYIVAQGSYRYRISYLLHHYIHMYVHILVHQGVGVGEDSGSGSGAED